MVVYKVSSGAVPLASDINQVYDTFSGLADAGKLSMAASVATPAAPTATVAAGTGLGVGDYYYSVSFITGYLKSDGTYAITGETLTKSIGAKVTTTTGNQKVNLKLPIGPANAPHVIGRRVYRSKVGTISPMYLAAEILNDTQVDYADTKPDTGLNTAVKENTTDTTGTRFTQLICDELVVGRPRLKTNGNVIYTAEFYGGSDKPYIMRWDGGASGGGSDMGIGYQSTTTIKPKISIYNASDVAVIDFGQDGSVTPSGGINIKGTLDGTASLNFPDANSIYFDQYGNIGAGPNAISAATWSVKDANGRLHLLIGIGKDNTTTNEFRAYGGGNDFFHDGTKVLSVYRTSGNQILRFGDGQGIFKWQIGQGRFEFRTSDDSNWVNAAAGTFVNASSRDYKKNIELLTDDALEIIRSAKVCTYHFNNEEDTDKRHIGLISEEAPKQVTVEGDKGMDSYAMTSVSWRGIQQLIDRLEAAERRIVSLEDEVTQLKGKA
ncbi:tail fiber domain-containing protein [Bacillus cereus]|uniref:tail fiber domain-containing protein n=1 Tax=Bacillus cereus TaxID=1396 RepID=UPI00254FB692|nr:tail fiber domain-containing protein [Bacillus cereus]MDK7480998.1 tail fiber domain-containing protein [Bacillus cereus]